MSGTAAQNAIAVVGVDIGKNSFHVVGLDDRGAIVLRQKWSRSQVRGSFCEYAAVSDDASNGFRERRRVANAFENSGSIK